MEQRLQKTHDDTVLEITETTTVKQRFSMNELRERRANAVLGMQRYEDIIAKIDLEIAMVEAAQRNETKL